MKELADYLASWLSPERKLRMQKVLDQRTRYIAVVLEDLFQEHNASAVLRTCDALGIQDIHAVEKNNTYRVNPEIALGSAQWLSLQSWRAENGIQNAYAHLRDQGYRIVATSPHATACALDDLDLNAGPIALVFGTELSGLTTAALDGADEYVYIPMHGFVESFNISVSAAICLHHVRHKLLCSKLDWTLNQTDRDRIWLQWLRQSIKSAKALEKRFFDENPQFRSDNSI